MHFSIPWIARNGTPSNEEGGDCEFLAVIPEGPLAIVIKEARSLASACARGADADLNIPDPSLLLSALEALETGVAPELTSTKSRGGEVSSES